jgi:hypothetical protein
MSLTGSPENFRQHPKVVKWGGTVRFDHEINQTIGIASMLMTDLRRAIDPASIATDVGLTLERWPRSLNSPLHDLALRIGLLPFYRNTRGIP